MEKFTQRRKPTKTKRTSNRKLTLTPEVQALYFQCLAGKLHNLSHEEQGLIIQVFHQQFPALQREAKRYEASVSKENSFLHTLINWVLYVVLIVLGILVLLVALEYGANAQDPTPLPRPAPLIPQDTRIQTTVDGIDHIQTKAILSDNLAGDQLEAVRKIVDDGTSIAEKRLELEYTKFHAEKHLEFLRITQGFILWGFVASIPFIFTLFWVFKHLLGGYHTLQKERLEYKIKELESAERQIAMTNYQEEDMRARRP